MSSTYEDTLLDFDLNFLNQTTNNTDQDLPTKYERIRKSVIFLKKKVLFSHSAVTRYKNARNYAKTLENNQVFSKEGCKQHLITIKNLEEQVGKLKNELQTSENTIKEHNEANFDLQNKVEALNSHVNQLKVLVQEKTKNEQAASLRVDKKPDKACLKDVAKKGLLEKQNETLRKQNENLGKEIETLRNGNATFQNLERDIETLRKENEKIPNLEKEIKNLRKEYAGITITKKVNETLRNENAKIPNLEKENEALRKENSKISNLERDIETLRKENSRIPILEKQIETLRKETAKFPNSEKVNEGLIKENIKIPKMEKEIATLLKQLALIKEEKSKLQMKCDQLLRKCESLPDTNSDLGNNSDTYNDIFEDSLLSPPPNNTIAKKSPMAVKCTALHESDNEYSNEVVSVDTGRGSSLSFSDNEKCLHSPEYFLNDSPPNKDIIENKPEARVASVASPIQFEESVTTAVIPTPVQVENQEDTCECESLFISEKHPKLSTTEKSVIQINVTSEVACPVDILDNNTPINNTKGIQEKECLELNNSNNLQCESHTDSEIEKILSRIKLNYNVVSPIPRTPTRMRLEESLIGISEGFDITKILRITEKVAKMEQELEDVKKTLNDQNIQKLLSKLNPTLTLQSQNESLTSQYDGDLCNVDIVNDDSNQIACSENIMETQNLLIEDLKVNTNSNLELLDLVVSQDDNNIVHRLSTDTTNSLLNNLGEKRLSRKSLPNLNDDIQKQPFIKNQIVFEELTRDSEMAEDIYAICPQSSVEKNELITRDRDTIVKKVKSKKNTKLEKLKKNLEPKYKIRREKPLVKSRTKPKKVSKIRAPIEKKVTVNDTSVSLNDKDVYEKAVKVMAEINSQKGKTPPNPIKVPLCPKTKTHLEKPNDAEQSIGNDEIPQNRSITTRSKRKLVEQFSPCSVVTKDTILLTETAADTNGFKTDTQKEKGDSETSDGKSPRKKRRRSSNEPEIQCKRILRSSTLNLRLSTEDNIEPSNSNKESNRKSIEHSNAKAITSNKQLLMLDKPSGNASQCQQLDDYDDLNLFSEDTQLEKKTCPVVQVNTKSTANPDTSPCHPKESILCVMIQKYGVNIVRPFAKKIPDLTIKQISEKIEKEIEKILELPPNETKDAMNRFVADLGKLNYKAFLTGLMKYLTKRERKTELFGKIFSPPAPAMTKAEQVLLYVISHLKNNWPCVDIIDDVLSNIEYTLFALNRTPDFDVIESTSHFYALLCRYFGAKSRLRLFILDAMYCIQFKSVPLIKQCLDVWMHIIPLAHMGIAKTPLVTSLVYLLHFYKCDDKFNRVQEIRNILSRKYFYQIMDWNEKEILEMFKNSIMDLNDIPVERKMLRLALIILAKRQGPRWCQNNIIKNLLLPMIETEAVRDNVKEFCVSMIGPLMKPYPVDMKVHCEIAFNQLTDILNNNPSRQMEEAAIMSMMFINRHNQHRINQTLLSLKMRPLSPELEKIIRDYVRVKPLKMWKKNLSKLGRC